MDNYLIRQRRLAETMARGSMPQPQQSGETTEQYLRRHDVEAGRIAPESEDALSFPEKASLSHYRQYLENGGLASQVPSKWHGYLRALVANAPDTREAARAKTSENFVASVQKLQRGDIDAAEVLDFQTYWRDRAKTRPLSRQLRSVLSGLTQISSDALDARAAVLGLSLATRLALALEAAAKGVLTDAVTPDPVMLSDDAQAVLANETLPMYHEDYFAKCGRMGYSLQKATAMALECGGKIYYGDRTVQHQPIKTMKASADVKPRKKLIASITAQAESLTLG